MRKAGVAPGSYTLQLGAPAVPSCVDDVNGPVNYGMPAWFWYDSVNAWYDAQFPSNGVGTLPIPVLPPPAPPVGPAFPVKTAVPLDPYGTDSTLRGLRGFRDAPTIAGVRIDVLGIVVGAALGIGLLVSHFAKR